MDGMMGNRVGFMVGRGSFLFGNCSVIPKVLFCFGLLSLSLSLSLCCSKVYMVGEALEERSGRYSRLWFCFM